MFASKNKQVVQIWIQVSHVEAVLERWSLGWCMHHGSPITSQYGNRYDQCGYYTPKMADSGNGKLNPMPRTVFCLQIC